MESPHFENKEELSVTSEVIAGKTFKELIYRGKGLPQDNRFLSFDEGGVFKYFYPGMMTDIYGNVGNKFYSIVKEGDEIVGLAELEKDPVKENNLWIKFVSVDPLYQGKGYASRLIEEMFKFAKSKDLSLETSYYSKEGKKLKKTVHRFAEEYSVPVIDQY